MERKQAVFLVERSFTLGNSRWEKTRQDKTDQTNRNTHNKHGQPVMISLGGKTICLCSARRTIRLTTEWMAATSLRHTLSLSGSLLSALILPQDFDFGGMQHSVGAVASTE